MIELCEEQGVKAYIFAPCIVYGKGDGFGNPISIQTKAIVQSAKVLRTVYSVDEGEPVSLTSTDLIEGEADNCKS